MGPLYEEVLKHFGKDKASIVFKHFPLDFHDKAKLASEASMAAHAQGKFWEYHDLIFQNQKQLSRADLESYAQRLGLDMATFNTALDQGLFTERVNEDMEMCRKAGVRGTPTIFINGRKYDGDREAPKIIENIEKKLLKKK